MKEEVYEKFANKALQYLENTEAFLNNQVPDYFQQVVKYHAIESWVFFGISVALGAVGVFFLFASRKEFKKDYREHSEGFAVISLIGGILLCVISLASGGCNLTKAIKATYAPKVFIVDYLRGKE